MQKSILKFLFGLMLSLLLTVNFAQVSVPTTNEIGDTSLASLIPTPKFKRGTKTYDSTGKWIGCTQGDPKNCLMVVTSANSTLDISLQGIIVE
ncbi:MAG: hypothetical protein WBP29_09400 [Candidatus Zixiibacteriota bacterium]